MMGIRTITPGLTLGFRSRLGLVLGLGGNQASDPWLGLVFGLGLVFEVGGQFSSGAIVLEPYWIIAI